MFYKRQAAEVSVSDDFPLTVVTGRLGACSETFIRRHMYELSPSRTAAIALCIDPDDNCWPAPGPVLVRGSRRGFDIRRRLYRRVAPLERFTGLQFSDLGRWPGTVKKFLLQNKTRVALGEFLDISHPYLRIFRELKIPFFVHAHGYDVTTKLRHPIWRRKYQDYNDSEGIITMSWNSRERLIDAGILSHKIYVVPYGVDVPALPPRSGRRSDNDVTRLVAVGRMVPKKAPLLLMEAFHLAIQGCPNMHLDVIGGGPLLEKVNKYVIEKNLEQVVTLHGKRSHEDVKYLVRSADIFVQHSITDPVTGDEEGLPVAILEAMANGLAVVSTRHAGIPEEVVENETGFMVDEGDTVGMARRISDLARDGEKRRAFGEAGWSRARECFSWEMEKSKLRQILGVGSGAI